MICLLWAGAAWRCIFWMACRNVLATLRGDHAFGSFMSGHAKRRCASRVPHLAKSPGKPLLFSSLGIAASIRHGRDGKAPGRFFPCVLRVLLVRAVQRRRALRAIGSEAAPRAAGAPRPTRAAPGGGRGRTLPDPRRIRRRGAPLSTPTPNRHTPRQPPPARPAPA